MRRFLYDNHNHSQFSFDGGRTTLERSARVAAGLGLGGICFTDHADYHRPAMKAAYEPDVEETFDLAARQAELERVRALLQAEGSGLRVFSGIEIGLGPDNRQWIADCLRTTGFDEVIASLHYLDDTDPYWGPYYEGKTWQEAYGHYLETLYREAAWLGDGFDILGHFDYIVRYAPYPQAGIRYRDFPDLLDALFRLLAERGQALEINTRTYQEKKGRRPRLDEDVLRRFRELGGEALSLGSDSHEAGQVGFRFDDWAAYLKGLGFRYLAHFEGRRRCMTRIP